MEYPGNPALSDDMKERIVSTFRQTVDTARKGNHKEALLGCDFILKLDPEFSPAQTLQDRLEALPATAPSPPTAGPPSPQNPSADELVVELRSLLGARRFQEAMQLAQQNLSTVSSHATLQVLAQEAQSRLEAEPYIRNFLDSASEALEQGGADEARKHLEKARALDPKHPGLLEMEKKVEGRAAASPVTILGAATLDDGAFSLDLEEPVTNFTLGAGTSGAAAPSQAVTDPLADFALLDESETDDQPLEAESLDEVDPFAALSGPAPVAEAEDQPLELDDPLADFSFSPEVPGSSELPEDPFAALGAIEEPTEETASPGPEAVDDDPFSVFSEETDSSGNEAELALGGGASGDARVGDLLAEGQAAFDRGDHQGAIDAWSRIFLIDLDNEEASRRIEAARQMKAESERQAEEIYHEGLEAWKNGSADDAKQAFEKVLAIDPAHVRAQEHLERLRAGEDLGAGEELDAGFAATDPLATDDLPSALDPTLLDEILVPPDPDEAQILGEESSPKPVSTRSPRASRVNRKFLVIGVVVLLAVGIGGAYLFSNRDAFFPNSAPPPAPGSEASGVATPLDRAKKLHESGKTKLAAAQLQRLPENHPSYGEAQKLLAEWALADAPAADSSPAIAQDQAFHRDDLIAEARLAESRGEFLRVKEVLAAAAAIAPLNGDEGALLLETEERLAPLQSEIIALAERDWDFALKNLWRKHTADPANRDVVRLLVNCYYNMAVRDLQRGDQISAIQNLDEALALAPDDEETARHRNFAETYSEGPTDLLYRIYVKYLPYR